MGTGTPTITVDMVLIKKYGTTRYLLLIQRRKPPYQGCWALPGGKLDSGESVEQAAQRELQEETGITGVALHQFHTYSEPVRDPRGHYISVAFYGTVDTATAAHAGDDASAAAWFSVGQLPPLAFDHAHIIRDALHAAFPGTTLMSKRNTSRTPKPVPGRRRKARLSALRPQASQESSVTTRFEEEYHP